MIMDLTQTSGRQLTLADIETRSHDYNKECDAMEELIAALETDLEAVKQKHLRGIKRQAAIVAAREAELNSAIESSPGLFTKPRTITVHGVKVGFTVSQGKLVWDDEELVVALIKKHRKADADTLLRIKEEPNKDALKSLPAVDLAKVGCRIEGAGDVVVLKRVAGDVEKLVNKLIEKLVEAMVSEK